MTGGDHAPPVAATQAGLVRGSVSSTAQGDVCVWRGIRYADARRFEAPRPPSAWTGIRPAVAFGPPCPQMIPGIPRPIGAAGEHSDEACLVLNVFSVAADDARRPVMVWIHGGAFVLGSADLYDSAHLAAGGEIVVVTINYRLGVLGFLDLGGALGEPRSPTNLGLRDQIAALAWVRDNIAAFGGDPDRVTIAGESAGSVSVSLLMLCDEATPLFHRAIMQSGALTLTHEAGRARDLAERFLALLGLNEPDLDALQALPVQRLLQVQNLLQRQMTAAEAIGFPWFDGVLLPATLADAHEARTPDIPLLAGSNRDEFRTFEILPGGLKQGRRDRLQQVLRSSLGSAATDGVMAAYPGTREGSRQLATDLYFAMPTLHFAERHAAHAPTWFYRFDIAHPLVGAAHGLELFYVFNVQGLIPAALRGGPLTGVRGALAGRMRRHWISFVRDGRMGPDWPAFEPGRWTTLLFNRTDGVADDPSASRRIAWAGLDSAVTDAGMPVA